MAHPNGGKDPFETVHDFKSAYDFIGTKGYVFLSTKKEKITAKQSLSKDGKIPIITFMGKNSRHGGVCKSCWGYARDCNGSWVGHCVRPLDKSVV